MHLKCKCPTRHFFIFQNSEWSGFMTEKSSSLMQYEGEKQPVIIQSVSALPSVLFLSIVSPHWELPVTLKALWTSRCYCHQATTTDVYCRNTVHVVFLITLSYNSLWYSAAWILIVSITVNCKYICFKLTLYRALIEILWNECPVKS